MPIYALQCKTAIKAEYSSNLEALASLQSLGAFTHTFEFAPALHSTIIKEKITRIRASASQSQHNQRDKVTGADCGGDYEPLLYTIHSGKWKAQRLRICMHAAGTGEGEGGVRIELMALRGSRVRGTAGDARAERRGGGCMSRR